MAEETELKFKVKSFVAVRRALRAAGAKHIVSVLQSDCYFDTPGGELCRKDCGLRIRTVRTLKAGAGKHDPRPLLTFKGPRKKTSRAKIRREIQTRIDDAAAASEILTACGMTPTMRLQKRRSSYRLGRCRVELDELPVLGRFVEIEGPGVRAIDAVRRKLAIEGEPITAPYTHLLREYCRKNKRPYRHIKFR